MPVNYAAGSLVVRKITSKDPELHLTMSMKKLELYTTLACPHCKTMKKTIGEVLPEFEDQYQFSEVSASSPLGYIKSLKNNIHSAPTLLIDGRVVARSAISKTELINILTSEL